MPTERASISEPSADVGKPDWTAVQSNVMDVEIVKNHPPAEPAENPSPQQGSRPAPHGADQSTSLVVAAPRSHPTGSTRAGIATYHEDAIYANLHHGIPGNQFDFNSEDIQPLINLFAPSRKCMVRHNDAWTAVEFLGPPRAVTAAQSQVLEHVTMGTNNDATGAVHGLRIYFFQDSISSRRPQSLDQVMVSLFRFYSKDPNAENDFSRDPIDNHEWKEFNTTQKSPFGSAAIDMITE
ncbi:hypothetical protein GQ607_006673 [Colletotrichum asianum]|uniref:Uncharacterized protein n=1 Tax=Colletotrichum asianum TaxID=702518 RepID=A0A8H3WGY4_9PEZI|nr:hypothetical protein GQ607_006673 [Colletotrichum asianum]